MKNLRFIQNVKLMLAIMTTYIATTSSDCNSMTPINGGVVTTVAGSGIAGNANGTGKAATFNNPSDICMDGSGNLFVADYTSNLIRQVVSTTGVVTTIAGSGTAATVDGTGAKASFNNPSGIAISPDYTTLYVSDYTGNKIRKIIIATGVVTTIAGTGVAGYTNGSGSTATFNGPADIDNDAKGNLYIADAGNHVIRYLTFGSNNSITISTIAGSGKSGSDNAIGTGATFNTPYGIFIDANQENLYVADTKNNLIRKITLSNSAVTTFAGSTAAGYKDDKGVAAQFSNPWGIYLDQSNNIYVTDNLNNRIRKITPAGVVSTFAGSGVASSLSAATSTFDGINGTGTTATFDGPSGIYGTTSGDEIYVTDYNTHRIRKLK